MTNDISFGFKTFHLEDILAAYVKKNAVKIVNGFLPGGEGSIEERFAKVYSEHVLKGFPIRIPDHILVARATIDHSQVMPELIDVDGEDFMWQCGVPDCKSRRIEKIYFPAIEEFDNIDPDRYMEIRRRELDAYCERIIKKSFCMFVRQRRQVCAVIENKTEMELNVAKTKRQIKIYDYLIDDPNNWQRLRLQSGYFKMRILVTWNTAHDSEFTDDGIFVHHPPPIDRLIGSFLPDKKGA